jgi:hypothetical protein
MRFRIILGSAFAALLLSAAVAVAANPHFVGDPTCTITSNQQVNCQGKVAGLGTAPVSVTLTADFSCENRGGHFPGGHVSSRTRNITPRGGQITFNETTTSAKRGCPPGLTPVFGDSATLTIVQNGVIVFQEDIPIT